MRHLLLYSSFRNYTFQEISGASQPIAQTPENNHLLAARAVGNQGCCFTSATHAEHAAVITT